MKTLDEHLQTLLSVPQNSAERYARVVKMVQWVENQKQIHLSDDERRALAVSLTNQPETLETILRWAENVVRSKDFRCITFDMFLNSEPTYTSGEIPSLIEHGIEKRKLAYIQWHKPTEEELCRLGLERVQVWWRAELDRQIDKHAERIDKKCKRLRAQFYLLPQEAKDDLWIKAVEKGIVEDGDKFTEQILPMLVPQMIEEFESIITAHTKG
jgi:hypothetical protein